MTSNNAKYSTALYMRLSRDDENFGDSVSIETQRIVLQKFAQENGLFVFDEYVDDGWSGTNYDRLEFNRLVQDATDKKINLVLCKDLSRLGRDYIEAGRYTNFVFPSLGCRFIALNDGVDTLQKNIEMLVIIKNVMNDLYARDTSSKIKAVKQSAFKSGKYVGCYAPLGYKKSEADKHILEIDLITAPIVKHIFDMRLQGDSFRKIAAQLNAENRANAYGLVYCEDCGAKMRHCTTKYFEKRQDHFVCGSYRSNTGHCTAHFIRAVVLEQLVLNNLQVVISYVTVHENYFRQVMTEKMLLKRAEIIKSAKRKLAQKEKRLAELDRLFIKIYEDNVSAKLSDERFAMMSEQYEDEQAQLRKDISELQAEIVEQERQTENLELFIKRTRKYEGLNELTPYVLRELVKAIYVEKPDKSSGKRKQKIRIQYDLIGFIPINELLQAEKQRETA